MFHLSVTEPSNWSTLCIPISRNIWLRTCYHQTQIHTGTRTNPIQVCENRPTYMYMYTSPVSTILCNIISRKDNKQSRLARRLWTYLVHQEDVREIFIDYIFHNKVCYNRYMILCHLHCFLWCSQRVGAVVDDEPAVQRILYRQPDSPVSCLCINAVSHTHSHTHVYWYYCILYRVT